MMVDVEAIKRNYSKEDFVCIIGNLFLATGWLIIGIHYLHSDYSIVTKLIGPLYVVTFLRY